METTPTTFYFPSDVNLFLGSAKRKSDTNLAVIELVREIEKEGRFATPDEQEPISHYVGYGDSSVLSARCSDVVEAVTNEEFADLRASTLNAQYTSLPIIRGIWAALLRMGAGKLSVLRVLDPSAGIGHFQSASPECVRTIARWVEIELDKLTASILKIPTRTSKTRTWFSTYAGNRDRWADTQPQEVEVSGPTETKVLNALESAVDIELFFI